MEQMFEIIGLVLAVLTFLFHTIGVFSPYWMTATNISFGLVTACVFSICTVISNTGLSSYGAVQFFGIVGFLVALVLLVLAICHLVVGSMKTKTFKLVLSILSFVCTFCIFLAVVIFGADTIFPGYDIGWSMILCILALLFAIGAGVVYLIAFLKFKA